MASPLPYPLSNVNRMNPLQGEETEMKTTRTIVAVLAAATIMSSMSFASQNPRICSEKRANTETAVWGVKSNSEESTRALRGSSVSCTSRTNQAAAENDRGPRAYGKGGIRGIVSQILETAIWGGGFVPPPVR